MSLDTTITELNDIIQALELEHEHAENRKAELNTELKDQILLADRIYNDLDLTRMALIAVQSVLGMLGGET
jgi:predicted DNA-binding ArsR family transcriptional regulator